MTQALRHVEAARVRRDMAVTAAAAAQPPRLSGRDGYSIFVRWMKVLLPALAVALVLLVVLWPQFSLNSNRLRLLVSDMLLEQANSLTMLNARYEGVDENDRPFTVTADEATQSAVDEDLIELELPRGDITLSDGTWLALNARQGRYQRDAQLLDLAGAVTLFHDQGFELRTEAARIDLGAGTAEGAERVDGQGPLGELVSEGFRVQDRGERIFLTGKSRMVIYMGSREP